MPSVPHLGMGRESSSSPTTAADTNANSTSVSTSTAAAPAPASASPAASPSDALAAEPSSSSIAAEDAPVPTSSPSPSASSSRPSFLSRLGLPLPLRRRNRNVADFHIRPDEPHKKYCAGEHVYGAVVVVVVKPVRITHLVVSLHGYVRVRKDPTGNTKSQNGTTLPPGGGSSRPQYHGNGFASLFQDEQVLSGEGRLEPGKYEFGFDLVFPEKGLPSSIDFERGTISYTISATLTRPTAIAPTATCDRKVTLIENVDIGLLPPTRPRTIFLEPISRRTRRKRSMGLEKASITAVETHDVGAEADSGEARNGSEDRDQGNDQRSPVQSDMRSEISGESGMSASTGVSRTELSLSQVGTLSQSAKQQAVDDKTITATIELLKSGCLAGETVSVRVTVQHIKRVKSMTGVIVTLFRQGKVDVSPPESKFTDEMLDEGAKHVEKDEVYPRSRTGLGGLSLSSSGSTSIFRKDLDQNMAPLIIDPATMQTSVTVSVRMPDDSFPTIKGVPGDMISFKYLVEVIVDLGGRLANQFSGTPTSRVGSYSNGSWETTSNTYGYRRGANMADTSQIRREKGVISVSMETMVGTVDSSRSRKKSRASPSSRRYRMNDSDEEDASRSDMGYMEEIPYEAYPSTNGQYSSHSYFPPQPNGSKNPPPGNSGQTYSQTSMPSQPPYVPPLQTLQLSHSGRPDYSQINGSIPEMAPEYVPPPDIPDETRLTDKERVRQAETRLLPSQPPAGPSSSDVNGDEDNLYDAEDTPRPPYAPADFPSEEAGEGPSAPTEEELTAMMPNSPETSEDKQELERRRLMNEASAPPEFLQDEDQRNSGPSTQASAPDLVPSAPTLDDVEDFAPYGSGAGSSSSANHQDDGEQLPAYQR